MPGRTTAQPALRSAKVVDGDLRLVLNNTLDAIEAGRREMAAFLAPSALSPRAINRLEVVFEELVSNVVRHGFQRGADHTLAVRITVSSDAVVLVFEDDGAPFDPLSVAEPEPLASLETTRLGGLGLPLVRRLTREFRYERLERTSRASGFAPRNRVSVTIVREAASARTAPL